MNTLNTLYQNIETGALVLATRYDNRMREFDLLPEGVVIMHTRKEGDVPIVTIEGDDYSEDEWAIHEGNILVKFPGRPKYAVYTELAFRNSYRPVD